MEKEKTEVQLSTEDCIYALMDMQERTRCYDHMFPEMSKLSCDTWAAIDKAALERAIQALKEKDQMEKEKTEEFQAPDFSLSDCIEFLRYLQERTRSYGQIFREMGEDYCKKLASTEKALLESAIQYLNQEGGKDGKFRRETEAPA